MKGRRVVLFGAGDGGNSAWLKITRNPALFDDEYICFSDNDKSKWGKKLHDIQIVSPQILTDKTADLFVIASRFHNSIRTQLINEQGISSDKIVRFGEYEGIVYCEEKYLRRYGDYAKSKDCGFDLSNIVVYTAIIGDYDDLKEPEFLDDNITYVCITDNKRIKSKHWNIQYVNNTEKDNVRMARKIKINPQLFFSDFETSVWIDGKLQIVGDIREYIQSYGRKSPMLCFPHFDRECIYDEGGKCIFLGYGATRFGDKKEIIDQMSKYYAEGYPFDNGLFETGCVVRRHNDELLISVMTQWMEEIRKYSYRDQLSLPVVCRRNSFQPDISPIHCFCNRWLKLHQHKQ